MIGFYFYAETTRVWGCFFKIQNMLSFLSFLLI